MTETKTKTMSMYDLKASIQKQRSGKWTTLGESVPEGVKNAQALANFAAAYHMIRANGTGIYRIGTHTVSPNYLSIWVLDRASPSGRLQVGPSVRATPENRTALLAMGVRGAQG